MIVEKEQWDALLIRVQGKRWWPKRLLKRSYVCGTGLWIDFSLGPSFPFKSNRMSCRAAMAAAADGRQFFSPWVLEQSPAPGLVTVPARLRNFQAIATFIKAHTKMKRSKAEVFSCFPLPDFVGLFVVGESLFNWSGSVHTPSWTFWIQWCGRRSTPLSVRKELAPSKGHPPPSTKKGKDQAEATYMSLKFTTIYFAC